MAKRAITEAVTSASKAGGNGDDTLWFKNLLAEDGDKAFRKTGGSLQPQNRNKIRCETGMTE